MDELEKDVDTWGEDGAWEIEVLERISTMYFFNEHRCPYYEKHKEKGLEGLGVPISCRRDEPFARGLDPRLRLSRTQTSLVWVAE